MRKRTIYRHPLLKRLFTVALVSAVLWCSMGFVLWSCARKICYEYVHRHRAHISNRDTIVVSISEIGGSKDLAWTERNEICYKGQMFDIKKQIRKGDKIIFTGHYDKFENKLFKLLNLWLEDDNHSPASPLSKQPVKWITDAVVPSYYSMLFHEIERVEKIFPPPVVKCSPGISSPPFQPPRIAVTYC